MVKVIVWFSLWYCLTKVVGCPRYRAFTFYMVVIVMHSCLLGFHCSNVIFVE